MSDTIGRIPVPSTNVARDTSGSVLPFPLTTQFAFGFSVDRPVITHRFGSLDAKQEQRYFVGIGPRRFTFKRSPLRQTEVNQLRTFWESMQGPWRAFNYTVPNPDGTTSAVMVNFEQAPLSFQHLAVASQVGLNLIEVVDPNALATVYSSTTLYAVGAVVSYSGNFYTCIQAGTGHQPDVSILYWVGFDSYPINNTCARFPSSTLNTALLAETQEIIPLVHIRVREAAVPDIYLSDRRVTVGGQLYLPRLTGIGEPGSDVLISQDIRGAADNVKFTFGNGDRVMTLVSNDTDLKYAQIDLCLYHVNTGILLQLWKGVIQNYNNDGTANFPVACSDGFFQIMNQYPERQISRQCWKAYNDPNNCPWSTKGASSTAVLAAGGDPTKCDYYLESANGCQVHGMSPYFGGQQCDPQGVLIKDDSTGFLGLGRNSVTATSIVSETAYGLALPEIWCNSGGNPLYAFMVNAIMVDYRDESTYSDSLGIIGAGPIGGFTQPSIVTNADGYRYIVAPTLDGFTSQGFQVNGNLNVTQNQPGMGLRQVQGNDPANPNTDSFSLGSGTPQVWEPNNCAAGVSICELRIQKPSAIQPSTPDQHSMVVPLDYGLSGWVWDASGSRTAVQGLTNPFWIAVNMLLRALAISGPVPTPLTLSTITVTLPPSGFFSFSGTTAGIIQMGAEFGNPIALVAGLIELIGSAFAGNAFSVPMSNAANQAEVIMQQNLANWQSLAAVDLTTANKAVFEANWTTIWNAYVTACNTIIAGDPNGSDAKKALNASVTERESGGKYDWVAYYYTPIATSATPGDSITLPDLAAQQLATFVLPSLMNSDGVSGCAQIAGAQVPVVLGTGTETQFQFQGAISSQKPFRDWLKEVLDYALGYYTWEFGQLNLGIRSNASAVDTYNRGNTLYRTLRTGPIAANFEQLVLSYADQAYAYQANTGTYVDKDHAAYYGRAGSPLTTPMHSVGTPTLSQALRFAATRTREEIGGVKATEWRDARSASWQTTLLGLSNTAGQVVSMTDPEIPGIHGTCNVSSGTVTWASGDVWDSALLNKDALIDGILVTITAVTLDTDLVTVLSITVTPSRDWQGVLATPPNGSGLPFYVITMSFRLQKWSLKKDYSITLEGQTVTDSMYDLEVGPKPTDVIPSGMPALFYPIPLGPAWAPYQIQAPSFDAIFPSEWNFDSDQQYTTLADGSVNTSLVITGKLPVNEFSATGGGGPVIGTITQSSVGGSLPANSTLYVALCAVDASGLPCNPSAIAIIGTSASGTDTFTLSNITWPAVAGLASYVLFVSTQDDLICEQATGTLTAGTGGTVYTPGSITFSGPISRSTWALPSPYISKIRIKAKMGGHLGIMGVLVDSVTTNTVTCAGLIDTSSTPPALVGRALSVIGREGASTPWLSVTITAYNHTTGTLTVSPQAVVSGNAMQSIQAGDIVIVRMMADGPNTSTPTQITDAGWINSQSAYLGLNSSETGDILRVIAGLGRGQTRKITGVTSDGTGFTWDLPLYLDGTSIFITEEPTWEFISDSTTIDNGDYTHQAALNVAATNFINRSIIVAGFTVDENGNESPDGDGPIREDWIYGAEGSGPVAGFTLQADGTLAVGPDVCPAFYLNTPFVCGAVNVYLKTAPTGAALTININAGGVTWMTLTIPANGTSIAATSTQISAAGTIAANTNVSVDITNVGTIFPGSDLSVFIYS